MSSTVRSRSQAGNVRRATEAPITAWTRHPGRGVRSIRVRAADCSLSGHPSDREGARDVGAEARRRPLGHGKHRGRVAEDGSIPHIEVVVVDTSMRTGRNGILCAVRAGQPRPGRWQTSRQNTPIGALGSQTHDETRVPTCNRGHGRDDRGSLRTCAGRRQHTQAEHRSVHGRRPRLGGHGVQRPSRPQDATLRRHGSRGVAVRPFLRGGAGVLTHPRQRDDGAAPESVRLLQLGQHPAAAGDNHRRGAREGGLRQRALRQMAPRTDVREEPGEPRCQRLRRVALRTQLLRQ